MFARADRVMGHRIRAARRAPWKPVALIVPSRKRLEYGCSVVIAINPSGAQVGRPGSRIGG